MKVNQKGMDALHRPSFFQSLNSKMSCPINDLPQIESYITLDTSIKGFTEATESAWLSERNVRMHVQKRRIANNLFRGRK